VPVPDQRAHTALFQRLRQAPLSTFALALEDPAPLAGHEGPIENAAVQARYTLRDLPDDNVFVHTMAYAFAPDGDRWRVGAVKPGRQPPFWTTGDVSLRGTPH